MLRRENMGDGYAHLLRFIPPQASHRKGHTMTHSKLVKAATEALRKAGEIPEEVEG